MIAAHARSAPYHTNASPVWPYQRTALALRDGGTRTVRRLRRPFRLVPAHQTTKVTSASSQRGLPYCLTRSVSIEGVWWRDVRRRVTLRIYVLSVFAVRHCLAHSLPLIRALRRSKLPSGALLARLALNRGVVGERVVPLQAPNHHTQRLDRLIVRRFYRTVTHVTVRSPLRAFGAGETGHAENARTGCWVYMPTWFNPIHLVRHSIQVTVLSEGGTYFLQSLTQLPVSLPSNLPR